MTSLTSVGSLTLRPLLLAHTPEHLVSLITSFKHISYFKIAILVPPVIRAIRNILVSTADAVWGHIWGVGVEKRIVGTGLEDLEPRPVRTVKGVDHIKSLKAEADHALALIFEVRSIMSVLITAIQSRLPALFAPASRESSDPPTPVSSLSSTGIHIKSSCCRHRVGADGTSRPCMGGNSRSFVHIGPLLVHSCFHPLDHFKHAAQLR
jgi:hypothetical protein